MCEFPQIRKDTREWRTWLRSLMGRGWEFLPCPLSSVFLLRSLPGFTCFTALFLKASHRCFSDIREPNRQISFIIPYLTWTAYKLGLRREFVVTAVKERTACVGCADAFDFRSDRSSGSDSPNPPSSLLSNLRPPRFFFFLYGGVSPLIK